MATKTMTITLPGGGILAAAGLAGSQKQDYEASPGETVRVVEVYGQSMIDDGIAVRVTPKAKGVPPAQSAPPETTPGKKAEGADKGKTKQMPTSAGAPGDAGAGDPASSTTDTVGAAAVVGDGSSSSQTDQGTDPEAASTTSEQGQV